MVFHKVPPWDHFCFLLLLMTYLKYAQICFANLHADDNVIYVWNANILHKSIILHSQISTWFHNSTPVLNKINNSCSVVFGGTGRAVCMGFLSYVTLFLSLCVFCNVVLVSAGPLRKWDATSHAVIRSINDTHSNMLRLESKTLFCVSLIPDLWARRSCSIRSSERELWKKHAEVKQLEVIGHDGQTYCRHAGVEGRPAPPALKTWQFIWSIYQTAKTFKTKNANKHKH